MIDIYHAVAFYLRHHFRQLPSTGRKYRETVHENNQYTDAILNYFINLLRLIFHIID